MINNVPIFNSELNIGNINKSTLKTLTFYCRYWFCLDILNSVIDVLF